MTCPVCGASNVYASHRRGFLERKPLTWIGLLPFRCGQCQARFHRMALKDPRRHRRGNTSPADQRRPPRWKTPMRVAVTVISPGQDRVVLEGVAENASLQGVCVSLPCALAQDTQVSVSLEGGPGRTGSVRWMQPQVGSEILHGIDYHVPLDQRASHARPFRRLRFRRWLRRALIVLIGLAGMAVAAYGLVYLVEVLRTYDPWSKFYEPKDTERQRYEQLMRSEESKRMGKP